MSSRPTPERLAEIRAIRAGMGAKGLSGPYETYPWPSHVGESELLDATRDLLAEVDALTKERDQLRAKLIERENQVIALRNKIDGKPDLAGEVERASRAVESWPTWLGGRGTP